MQEFLLNVLGGIAAGIIVEALKLIVRYILRRV